MTADAGLVMTDQLPSDEQALVDAVVITKMVETDPLYVAREYARMQEAVQGAYVLIAALLHRLNDAVTLTQAEMAATGSNLNIVKAPDGSVRVSLGSRAERRRK